MPPKKRARVSSVASTPLAESQPKTPAETPASTGKDADDDEDVPNDPWTDDQETSLFKSLIRWKPTGLHKHFRMISISQDLRSHGYVTSHSTHTRSAGIWSKLSTMYDLDALDERENTYAFSDQGDPLDPSQWSDIPSFKLPEEDFGEGMWQKRFPEEEKDGSEGEEPQVPELTSNRDEPYPVRLGRDTTKEGLENIDVADAASPPSKKGASKATRGRGRGRPARGRGRQSQSAASEENDEEEEGDEEQGEEDEDEDDEEESEQEEEPKKEAKGPGRGWRRGRGRGKKR